MQTQFKTWREDERIKLCLYKLHPQIRQHGLPRSFGISKTISPSFPKSGPGKIEIQVTHNSPNKNENDSLIFSIENQDNDTIHTQNKYIRALISITFEIFFPPSWAPQAKYRFSLAKSTHKHDREATKRINGSTDKNETVCLLRTFSRNRMYKLLSYANLFRTRATENDCLASET